MGESSGAYRFVAEKLGWGRLLGRPSRGWEDNIKLDNRELGLGTWTGLIWPRTGTGGGVL